ncbi:DUF1254 domain-containing protein [Sinorhizobium meliloti]|uniref:DUF1254 domain-containing protein n=1 Tax=Rhizobium meliloti TaxID=382 RepID=UPI000FDBA80B|nr:DUF1254 domain-containing protein [Sinorhizobium meliloti]MDX1110741.1 DUF1214 domain-containing protein [Sinorhizobium medicae]MDW9759211.1 DUF1214 domain-containing protein [Sinorhizobium meliloti]MDX0254268.1 DUF1214 domain-containing protein [Sinorhizobium meliloti]MDX0299589.1 DUF1214 domain-containing protein [Sinorhizobium meliloti]RVG38252.1 DUF1254 domain-containing protein [Sinorhizobium meliloti]
MFRINRAPALALLSLAFAVTVAAQDHSGPKFKAEVPANIQTPDAVETRIGTLKFSDGLPDQETVQKVYDNIDFSRGVEAFLSGMPAASVYALCQGLQDVGVVKNKGIGITENLMDARSLFLTANTTTVYVFFCVDLTDGPVVTQVPPGVLGPVDDAYFRYVTDVGVIGPDRGKGGKYLFVPPGYSGELPSDGYFVTKSPTHTNLILYRAFVKDGDIAAAVKNVKDHARVYPLSAGKEPPETTFINISGKQFNTIHANDFHFYEELNSVIQAEPGDAFDPETVGLFASIGIKKGKPFAPDDRMKAILTDAIAVGNATARSMVFAPRDERAKFYPDRQWNNGFIGNSYQFLNEGERMLDARTMFHYAATGITPAMADAKPGTGSAYAFAVRDATGAYLDGSKTYKITLPSPIPAGQFWSFTVYDNQTRSMLETDQKLAGIDSNQPDIKKNEDGSVTIWFSPKVPAGHETNWVQTMPGKGWNTILRLYAPLEPWFDKSWKPGDFERVE